MKILVINSGSSSIKFSIFDSGALTADAEPLLLLSGEVVGIGEGISHLRMDEAWERRLPDVVSRSCAGTTLAAVRMIFDAVSQPGMPTIDALGYRVVHPGPHLRDHQRITPGVLDALELAASLAPLHEASAVTIIREGQARFPEANHYACFDTVFHQSLPEEAFTYALPSRFRDSGIRRYGFHGLSCESTLRSLLATGEAPRRMVIAHLGSGCSVTAVLDSQSVDTTMGLTPTGGVVMGTRTGDLDPGVLLYLLRHVSADRDAARAVEALVNRDSGIAALSGLPNDMQRVRKAAAAGDGRATLALKVFTRSIVKAIGGFCWLLGGLDAIVFTGGVGEHDALTRLEILAGLEGLDVTLDREKNLESVHGLRRISRTESKTAVYVVPAQEDLMIALHVARMARD